MYTLFNYPSLELALSIKLWTNFGMGPQSEVHV